MQEETAKKGITDVDGLEPLQPGIAVGKKGASPSIPVREEVEEKLKDR